MKNKELCDFRVFHRKPHALAAAALAQVVAFDSFLWKCAVLVGLPHFPHGAGGPPGCGAPGRAPRRRPTPTLLKESAAGLHDLPGQSGGRQRILRGGGRVDFWYARERGRWTGWDIGAFPVKLHAPADAASRQEGALCSSARRTSLRELAGLRGPGQPSRRRPTPTLLKESAASLRDHPDRLCHRRDGIPPSEDRQRTSCGAPERLAGSPWGVEVRRGRDPVPASEGRAAVPKGLSGGRRARGSRTHLGSR